MFLQIQSIHLPHPLERSPGKVFRNENIATQKWFFKPFLSISILNSSSNLSGISDAGPLSGIPDAGPLSGIPDAEGGGGDILITQLVKSRSKSDRV